MSWPVYLGTGEPHDGVEQLPPPPPWRQFDGSPVLEPPDERGAGASGRRRLGDVARATTYRGDHHEVALINSALLLRRPLLVTGRPGAGKSTLAYAIAHELRLGQVLHWPITSRSTLVDGLYRYDAIRRVEDASLGASTPDIGRYLRLGPLGTALLPWRRPRVLLVDEVDKSDIDLPNDLLTLFEDGEYEISELSRMADTQPEVDVTTADGDQVRVIGGRVRCHAFPIIVLTSNGEREFPPAFLRRCVRLFLRPPDGERLNRIVDAHLGAGAAAENEDLIRRFLVRAEHGDLATDQLLNAIYVTLFAGQDAEIDRDELARLLMHDLTS